jgi:plasmid stabilization system protein ParE
MQVKFTDKAISHLESIIDSYLEFTGEKSAVKFGHQIDAKIEGLLRFPETGFPEPLLKGRKKLFRSVIINRNYKIVYYVEGDTIWVAAIWNMRMHPDKLKRMI